MLEEQAKMNTASTQATFSGVSAPQSVITSSFSQSPSFNYNSQNSATISTLSTRDGQNSGLDFSTNSGETEDKERSRMCVVCVDEERCTVLIPCGHLVACRACTARMDRCPICRSQIRGSILVRLS